MADPIGIPPFRRRNHHDRTYHPSLPRRQVPTGGGRRDRGRRSSLLVTGCGDQTKDNGSDSSGTAAGSTAPLADKLPESIRDKGVIKVGSDIAYAPVEFKDDSGKTVGIDPDIANAMGKELGVKFEFQNGTFDALIGGLASKRYDIAMSAMTDTKERQEGIDPYTGKKVGAGVDFVDYFTAGVSLYTNKGTTRAIKPGTHLSGKTMAVQRSGDRARRSPWTRS
ncbi:hypothetical protein SHIRM173S_02979 [Streptomyces hirsutus]